MLGSKFLNPPFSSTISADSSKIALMDLLNARIVIVTGKGGVGKSTLAASIAYRAAQDKKRVLLVELGEESFYSEFLGVEGVSYTPKPVPDCGFEVALWDTESCLREYVLYYVKIESLFKVFFENRVMRTFINVAPALKELAILGKLTSGERQVGPKFAYDMVVLDGYATGHMLALLRAPKGMSETIRTGPMGHHSAQIHKVLTDPKVTRYSVVTLPDELPIVETLELNQTLRAEFGIEPHVFLNRFLEVPFSGEELQQLEDSAKGKVSESTFLKYIETLSKRHELNRNRIANGGLDITTIPLAYKSRTGRELIKEISSYIK
jgi:anion-transporting  ArsA/GET3 family ATPase